MRVRPIRALLVPALLAASLSPAAPAVAGTRLDLHGPWQFEVDADGRGESRGWAKAVPPDVETVSVPHTWGIGPHAEHEGVAWYWREVTVPPALAGSRLELHFGATFYKARVFVNGQKVGEHEGGHTAWRADATAALAGGRGLVAVEVDNRPGLATIPGWAMKLEPSGNVWYDWWHYGGIVRDVALVAHERAAIRRQEIRTRLGPGAAEVTTRVLVERFQGGGRLTVDARVLDPGGRAVARAGETVAGEAGELAVPIRLQVPDPEPWHFDQPRLYRMVVEVQDEKGTALDRLEESFGLRTVELRDRGLWLNGERVRLVGVTRHEESTQEGLAETRGTILHDWDDLKALQVVLTRPVHYPQHPEVLDYADRNGVLLVPEIPMWQFSEAQMKDPRVLALAKQMIREMIEQSFNHPSVFAWSVCNESATSTPGGKEYVRAMVEHVKALDPDRYVSYADDGLGALTDPQANANQHTDFLMMNQYFGSWHGPAEGLGPALERVGRMFPDKMLIVSEFGLNGPFAPSSAEADVLRSRTIESQLAEFARHPFVAGAVFWCYQDYKSHRNLWPGETTGFVEMGLVDEHRQRRPSYDVWRERTSPVRLGVSWVREPWAPPAGFRATVERRAATELPSHELRGYRLEWEARDHLGAVLASGGRELPVVGPRAVVEGSWPTPKARAVRLLVRVVRPTGFVAAERSELWWDAVQGGMTPEEARRRGLAAP